MYNIKILYSCVNLYKSAIFYLHFSTKIITCVCYPTFLGFWEVLMPYPITQFCSQLAHVVSYGWWRGVLTWTHYHPSTNHNSPHGRVVSTPLPITTRHMDKLWAKLCNWVWHQNFSLTRSHLTIPSSHETTCLTEVFPLTNSSN